MWRTKNKCKPITKHDVNKQLCAKIIAPRSEFELLGPNDKYRDENYKIYLSKCEEFRKKAKALLDDNIKVLQTQKARVGIRLDGEKVQEADRCKLVDENGDASSVENNGIDTNTRKTRIEYDDLDFKEKGSVYRKRTTRLFTDTPELPPQRQHYEEAWLRRHLSFCKFVQAARTILIKNRMLRNLKRLRSLTAEELEVHEATPCPRDRVLFQEVFEKFLEDHALELPESLPNK